jgi:acyl-CoA synthetase (AMP-forming)/AMP-acid ligase II
VTDRVETNLAKVRAALRDRWYAEGWFGTETLGSALRAGAVAYADTPIVFHSDQRPGALTLGEANERAQRMAGAFHELGLREGDVLAVQLPNWTELAIAYYAAASLGLVLLPIIHIYGPAEVGFILRESRAKALVVPDEWRGIDYQSRVAALGATPDLTALVVVGERAHNGGVLWSELEARSAPDFPRPTCGADDLCAMSYTSGTTSDPKGVMHSHNTLLAETRTHGVMMAPGPHVLLSSFPSGHIAGICTLAFPFLDGRRCIFMDAWDPADAAALVEEHGVTMTAGTPYFMMTFLDEAEKGTYDLSTLVQYATGGAGVPPSVVERGLAAGWFAFRSYGSTEHPTISSGFHDDPPERLARTDGRIAPGTEVRIVDDDGNDVAGGGEGEIWARGPEQFLGYRKAALDLESFDAEGWFKTGDIGRLDHGRYLTITDRKKDIIIRGGENLSSTEIEDVLARIPGVAEAAVAATPDQLYGEKVCAFVILRDGAELTLADVQAHFVASGVAKHKTPERLEVVADLPRNSMGKVKKVELRARLRREHGGRQH